jgi:hypothetical protein
MTMPGYRTYQAVPPTRRGMAVASLALGLAGIPALAVCGVGLVLALAGLALGVTALVRGGQRDLAVTGIVACVVTLVLGATVMIWLVSQAAKCGDSRAYPDRTARGRCIEREFPFVPTTTRARV